MVMKKLHEGPSGRHFVIKITQRKILDVGYWWPTTTKIPIFKIRNLGKKKTHFG
jgi:hypothetical protein